MIERLSFPKLQMPKSQGNDHAVGNEDRAQPRAQSEIQHFAAFVAAKCLHTRVVHHSDRTIEGTSEVHFEPAGSQVVWFGDRATVANLAGVTNRHPLDWPAISTILDALDQGFGSEILTRRRV